MKQINFSEVIKVTSCKVPLEPADMQALEKHHDLLPPDLIKVITEWGIGFFGDQDVRLHAPQDYFKDALPDDSNNPRRTYGGRTYRRECVIGTVQGGYHIIARDRYFYLFNRDEGVRENAPLFDMGHLLSFCTGGGLYTWSRHWNDIQLSSYYVSRLDMIPLTKTIQSDSRISNLVKSIEDLTPIPFVEFWSASEKCLYFPQKEALLTISTEDCKTGLSASLLVPDKGDPSDEFWQKMWEWFKKKEPMQRKPITRRGKDAPIFLPRKIKPDEE